jgi:hypothetical protein
MDFIEYFMRLITFLSIALVAYRVRNVAEILEKILEEKKDKK